MGIPEVRAYLAAQPPAVRRRLQQMREMMNRRNAQTPQAGQQPLPKKAPRGPVRPLLRAMLPSSKSPLSNGPQRTAHS